MQPGKTRIRLTWFAEISLTLLAIAAMHKGFEGVATTCIAGIIAITTGYQAAKSWNNNQKLKNQSNEKS